MEHSVTAIGLEAEPETVDGEPGLFIETETSDVDIQRVVGESAKIDVSTDILKSEMGQVELSLSLWLVQLVVVNTGVTNDEGVDLDVEGRMRGGVFRCEGVEKELEVRLCIGIGLVQLEVGSEELGRTDGHLSLEKWHDIHFYRHTCSTDHLLLMLVADDEVVEDETAWQADIYATYADLGAQNVTGDA